MTANYVLSEDGKTLVNIATGNATTVEIHKIHKIHTEGTSTYRVRSGPYTLFTGSEQECKTMLAGIAKHCAKTGATVDLLDG